jgi:apolipoprotein N-acyltransferase
MYRMIHNRWFLAALGGLIPAAAWPPSQAFFLLFIAFLPLFLLEEQHYRRGDQPLHYFFQVFFSMLLWNVLTTFWIWNASPAGAVMAFLINGLVLTLPWMAFHATRKALGDTWAYPGFFAYWLSIEYLHLNWDLAWPWLTLGNGFALFPQLVQWFEYTGALGGSLWILAVNCFLFKVLVSGKYSRLYRLAAYAGIPVLISFFILQKREKQLLTTTHSSVSVAVVQPAIDPFSDKFSGMDPQEQLQLMIDLSGQVCDSSTQLLVWPETALTENIVEENLPDYETYSALRRFLDKYPSLSLLTGASTYRFYYEGRKVTPTARMYREDLYYDAFNTAFFMEQNGQVSFYHKSKLVPGVEQMPYPRLFGFLESLAIDLDGISGSLGKSDSAIVFVSGDLKIAPVICYESVFGDHVREFVKKGADILCVITNDGWWKDTPGYKQHFQYARLRAVETRKPVARSANTGISGFIDPLGNIGQSTGWWVPVAIKQQLATNDIRTFYVSYGDYLGKTAAFSGLLLFFISFVAGRKWQLRFRHRRDG